MKSSAAVQRTRGRPSLHLVTSDEMLDHMKDTLDAIERRAFEIFEGHGRRPGRNLDDWLQAERELLHPMHLELSETDAALAVRAEMPGFSEDGIEVNLEPRRVTIRGRRETSDERRTGTVLYSEHCSDWTYRTVDLPVQVDIASDAVKASYAQGVLTIALPKLAPAQARPVRVEPPKRG